MTSQQGATFGHRLRLNSWFLGIGRSDPVEEVSPSPHHSCGIYFLPTSDFSKMNINFSGRDLKLSICNSLFCATEDLCHQCELYYYYYYYAITSNITKTMVLYLGLENNYNIEHLMNNIARMPSELYFYYPSFYL